MRKLNFKLYNLRVVTCNKLKHIIFKNKKLNIKILKNNNKLNPTKKKKITVFSDSLPNNSWYLLNKLNLNISQKSTLCKYGL